MFGRITTAIRDGDVSAEVLFEDSLVVVAGEQNRWAHRRKLSLSELMDETWILGETANVVQRLIIEAFREHGLELPRISVATTSPQLQFHLLATGQIVGAARSLLRFNVQGVA
jgi:DNA-binding transcriptional LysR family regulator